MQFQLDHKVITNIKKLIHENNDIELTNLLSDLHHADVAEILEELDFDQSIYIIKLLNSELYAPPAPPNEVPPAVLVETLILDVWKLRGTLISIF